MRAALPQLELASAGYYCSVEELGKNCFFSRKHFALTPAAAASGTECVFTVRGVYKGRGIQAVGLQSETLAVETKALISRSVNVEARQESNEVSV
eukprot:1145140-Pelagomonas_calceolata.AAC.3